MNQPQPRSWSHSGSYVSYVADTSAKGGPTPGSSVDPLLPSPCVEICIKTIFEDDTEEGRKTESPQTK